jgi:hypothetical protein
MRRALAFAGLLAAAALGAPPPPPELTIFGWDAGLEEARRRNVPVVVVLQKDGSTSFPLTNPAVAGPLADRAVVIVGHRPGGHQPAKRVDKKEKKEVEYCPTYPSIACSVHDFVYNNYAGRYDYKDLPAAFICDKEGKAVESGVEKLGPPAIVQKLEAVQQKLGPGVFRSEIDKLERTLQKGDEKLADEKLAAARRVYDGEVEGAQKELLRIMVQARLTRLDAKAEEMIEAAKKLEGKARSDQLHKIEREMRGRGPGEKAQAVMKELGIEGEK